MALFPLVWWGAVVNHSAAGGLHLPLLGGKPTERVLAAVVAYAPILVALVLCRVSGDRQSWRWPFQKESWATFGLFAVLGWLACVLPVYHAFLGIFAPAPL